MSCRLRLSFPPHRSIPPALPPLCTALVPGFAVKQASIGSFLAPGATSSRKRVTGDGAELADGSRAGREEETIAKRKKLVTETHARAPEPGTGTGTKKGSGRGSNEMAVAVMQSLFARSGGKTGPLGSSRGGTGTRTGEGARDNISPPAVTSSGSNRSLKPKQTKLSFGASRSKGDTEDESALSHDEPRPAAAGE